MDGNGGAIWPADNRLLVVIVNYKTAALTTTCLRSLEHEVKSVAGIRVAVVDSASGDGPALGRSDPSPWLGELGHTQARSPQRRVQRG